MNKPEKETPKKQLSTLYLRRYCEISLKYVAAWAIGYSRILTAMSTKTLTFENKRFQRIQTTVKISMQRDDNSRSSAGKKETITGFKINKQKRFLNDCMKHLHAKFLSENPELGISYSFCRVRPFWVVKATEQDRQTCLFIKHENLQYQADRLRDLNIIRTSNINVLPDMI